MTGSAPAATLRRTVGLFGAVMLGLGSIVGTGIFVSTSIATAVAGSWVLVAIGVAALVATCNALSSAQLAAAYPVSGGTYEYGYRLLSPPAGAVAGLLFLVAKSASAATAALGAAAYALHALNLDPRHTVPVALGAVVVVTAIVLGGMRRSSAVNAAIVTVTLGALLAFVYGGLRTDARAADGTGLLGAAPGTRAVLHATALMFVAYTGYGRIATLGEEVRDPARTIPRAVYVTLAVSLALYVGVTAVALAVVGPQVFAAAAGSGTGASPLATVADTFAMPFVRRALDVGAVTAMLGVLLNLVLGLSRVLLALGRRGDAPAAVARIAPRTGVPAVAVVATGLGIAGLVLIGEVRTTWSVSAFTVLVYYAITNAAALRLPVAQRRFSRAIAAAGLVACVLLAFQLEPRIQLAGLAIVLGALLWHAVAQRITRSV